VSELALSPRKVADPVEGGKNRGMSGKGTPATLVVAEAGVTHRLHEYAHDPAAASYGLEASEALGIEAARVHKTLVVTVERNGRWELAVGVVPVDAQLDLKAVATALGAKRADMAKAGDAERTTGYVLGGISPLGQRKTLPTVIDEDAMLHETIFVSAGRRGLEIELAADALCALTNAVYAPIAKR
jgi:Cys-tRNA(Pro)/Cys-tRNA(Cys) deacylase